MKTTSSDWKKKDHFASEIIVNYSTFYNYRFFILSKLCKYAVAHVQTGKGKPVRIPSKREFLSGFFQQLLKKERISEDHFVTLLLSQGQIKFVSFRIVKYLSVVLV